MNIVQVSPQLFPPAAWFASVPQGAMACYDLSQHWNKREKSTHRYDVADVNGRISLTVPVEKPESYTRTSFSDIRLSRHGNWWHVHRVTLESGYGRTPFFEHYFPKFEKFFDSETVDRYPFLWQYLQATTATLAQEMGMEMTVGVTVGKDGPEADIPSTFTQEPYWQIRHDRFGFLPGLSALDLLFSLGPESILYLRNHPALSN